MKTESVIFIPKQAAPTEEGWYYGRSHILRDKSIIPRFVHQNGMGFVASTVGYNNIYIELFDWFGPVPQIKEATI